MRFACRVLPAGRRPLERLFAEAAIMATLRLGGRIRSLSIAVVGDHSMQRLNRDFHAMDETTDVLAFDLSEDREIEGEVIVCAPFARREAKARGLSWRTELVLYVTHGILHLLGEDDHARADARRMRRLERSILDALGLPLPPQHLEELKVETRSTNDLRKPRNRAI